MMDRFSAQVQQSFMPALMRACTASAKCLDTDHLLAGLVRTDRALLDRILFPAQLERLERWAAAESEDGFDPAGGDAPPQAGAWSRNSESLPMSDETKALLSDAADQVDRLGEARIGTRHVLLGAMARQQCLAAKVLAECGVDLARSAEKVRSSELSPEIVRSRKALLKFVDDHAVEWGVTALPEHPMPMGRNQFHTPFVAVVGSRRPAEAKLWAPWPFLCIEVLSSEEKMSAVIGRAHDYLDKRVRYVWLLDPSARVAYEATPEAGLCEVRAAALRTENSVLELPLAEVFS
jgi:hypothetical protein